jgi:ATP-dependent Clp protease ATP-binding subunit ClpB
MTSNLGAGQNELGVMETVRQYFKPEFINRVDEMIVFNPLSIEDLSKIVLLQLDDVAKRLKEKNLTLIVDQEASRLLATKGYDPDFGARPLKRVIQHDVVDEVAKKILEGLFREGDVILVQKGEGDTLIIERGAATGASETLV